MTQRHSTAKPHSADTSPNWNDSRLSTSGSALTRSATDVTPRTRTGEDAAVHRPRKCSLTTLPQRSTCSRIVAGSGSSSDNFFSKRGKSEDLVGSFSEQDIAEILKRPVERMDSVPDTSSTSGNIPTLTIESAEEVEEERRGGKEGGGGEGGENTGGGGGEEGGGGVEGVEGSLQVLSPVSSGSREVSPEGVEPVVIPDTISPSMVRSLLCGHFLFNCAKKTLSIYRLWPHFSPSLPPPSFILTPPSLPPPSLHPPPSFPPPSFPPPSFFLPPSVPLPKCSHSGPAWSALCQVPWWRYQLH